MKNLATLTVCVCDLMIILLPYRDYITVRACMCVFVCARALQCEINDACSSTTVLGPLNAGVTVAVAYIADGCKDIRQL